MKMSEKSALYASRPPFDVYLCTAINMTLELLSVPMWSYVASNPISRVVSSEWNSTNSMLDVELIDGGGGILRPQYTPTSPSKG